MAKTKITSKEEYENVQKRIIGEEEGSSNPELESYIEEWAEEVVVPITISTLDAQRSLQDEKEVGEYNST